MTLAEAVKILTDAGVENPRYDARQLFMHFGKMQISELIFPDASCDSRDVESAIERRKNREPLQYIIGSVPFYREIYNVNSSCLIPRQDTEILVDYAVKNIPSGKRFLDLCTGSGCVAISTLKNTDGTLATAVDISREALEIARENAEKNDVLNRISFIHSDALTYTENNDFYAILSNPPYVAKEEYENLAPEIYFEPKLAFTAGDGGLEFYKKIISNYKSTLVHDGFFAFEIGYTQGEALARIAAEHGMRCEIIKDYSGNDRVAVLRFARESN